MLRRIAEGYRARQEELALTLSAEMGVAISFARAMQIPTALQHIEAAIHVLEAYAFEKPQGTMMVRKEPVGVCGLITPWNWPMNQITLPRSSPALAAGCTVVLKPSEFAPLERDALRRDPARGRRARRRVQPRQRRRPDGRRSALSRIPDIDMMSFTGSTPRRRAGGARRPRQRSSAWRQELGGKSPNVILPDADFARAVPAAVARGMRNVGQSCTRPRASSCRARTPRRSRAAARDRGRDDSSSAIRHDRDHDDRPGRQHGTVRHASRR